MGHKLLQVADNAPFFVQLAFWLGVGALLISITAYIYLVWLRMMTLRDQRIRENLESAWGPVFRAMRSDVPVSLPTVDTRDAPYFLAMWLEERDLASASYSRKLDELAETDLLRQIVRYLTGNFPVPFLAPTASQVIIASYAARWIHSDEIRNNLYDLADSDNMAFAIQACETLLILDDDEAPHLVVRLIFRFPEHNKYITTRLGAAGGEKVIRVLGPFLEHLPGTRLEDLIALIEHSDNRRLLEILVRLSQQERTDEERASLLRAIGRMGSPAQRELVVPYLEHEVEFIRIQAAAALAATGHAEDRHLLLPLLEDPEWWVRYRAARSFISLMGSEDKQDIDAVIEQQRDKFAKDILRHAWEELRWHTI